MNSIIVTKQLKKRFPTKNGFYEAVRGVDLEVFEQEIFGFLGPNGAGKTTTLRMITTLLPIDSGEAYVAGYDVQKQPQEVRKRIGYVSQQGGADHSATGYENLLLQGRLYGMSQAETKKATDHLVDSFSLGDCIQRFVSTYSGGQQRRLDVALGMIHKPKILFLDEPTTGLDPQNRANLWNQIKALKKEGIAIFITSHYLDEIDFLADRLAIMDQGKIVEVGSPKELKRQISGDIINIGVNKAQIEQTIQILQNQAFIKIKEIVPDTQHLRLYVEQGDVALTQILRLLDTEKVTLESISLSVPTLDDVFLKKTGRALREESI
jgi:ABC-2 type transport system ATP-binding protein